jgi:hypothetical protein
MAVNYAQAARRHFKDCRTLLEQQRSGNASHLAGLSAECALKAVLQGLGILVLNSSEKPSDRHHRLHVDLLWNEFQAFLSGPKAQFYLLDRINPFARWKVDQRYEEDLAVDLQTAADHREGAQKAMALLERAVMEGDVR